MAGLSVACRRLYRLWRGRRMGREVIDPGRAGRPPEGPPAASPHARRGSGAGGGDPRGAGPFCTSWIVVDLDLEKFFDRVNHDILMARLARRSPITRTRWWLNAAETEKLQVIKTNGKYALCKFGRGEDGAVLGEIIAENITDLGIARALAGGESVSPQVWR